ncbi:MAG: translocation/assembly module TamB domain-containing protein, partial [Sphingobacterium sp.]
MRYAPAIGLEMTPYNRQTFDLNLNIKSFEPISAFLDPSLTLEDGAKLEAHFSSEEYTAKFDAFSPFVKWKGFELKNLKISENANQNAFSLDIIADKLILKDSVSINHIEINNVLAKDSLIFSINAAQQTDSNYLSLNGNIHFAHNKPAYIKFNNSTIILNHQPWNINTDAQMRVSKGKFYLNNLQVSHENQLVDFNGIVSNDNDKLEIKFSRFNLGSLESFTKPLGIEVLGELNGKIDIYSAFKKPYLSADISTTPLVYNQIPIGHLKLVADFDPESKIANLDIQLIDDIRRGLTLAGTYQLIGDSQNINLKGKLNNAELIIFQPFIKNLASNLIGKISSDFEITGTVANPKFNGTSTIHNAEFSVNYLKTTYNINNQSVLIENNNILLDKLIFTDVKNHQAVSQGIVNLNKLDNPYIDISVISNNVMILNTNFK